MGNCKGASQPGKELERTQMAHTFGDDGKAASLRYSVRMPIFVEKVHFTGQKAIKGCYAVKRIARHQQAPKVATVKLEDALQVHSSITRLVDLAYSEEAYLGNCYHLAYTTKCCSKI